jgi:hypothetical protein
MSLFPYIRAIYQHFHLPNIEPLHAFSILILPETKYSRYYHWLDFIEKILRLRKLLMFTQEMVELGDKPKHQDSSASTLYLYYPGIAIK